MPKESTHLYSEFTINILLVVKIKGEQKMIETITEQLEQLKEQKQWLIDGIDEHDIEYDPATSKALYDVDAEIFRLSRIEKAIKR
jgi:hypothetical protein